jgi:hypothetical protein
MRARLVSFAAFLSVALIGVVGSTPPAQNSAELRAPLAFAGITEPQARSRALFTEGGKSDHESALYELPPGCRSADPRQ